MNDKEVIHVRLPRELVKRLDHWAIEQDLFRQGAVERLLTMALESTGYQYQPPAKARD